MRGVGRKRASPPGPAPLEQKRGASPEKIGAETAVGDVPLRKFTTSTRNHPRQVTVPEILLK
ncbi:MAG: hypothetical protein H5U07_01050 [Candidatus Aminicenantes bacterium]|nr:hypothetical protein [Candidatus Aminicenantes bacterium]